MEKGNQGTSTLIGRYWFQFAKHLVDKPPARRILRFTFEQTIEFAATKLEAKNWRQKTMQGMEIKKESARAR